jgi:glycerophosphoryl diester phosphodiesterase
MYFEGPKPRVLAHRGLALEHAENTLGAFHAAIQAGADIVETDVHLSKDGRVIIAHDPGLERVAGAPGLVSDFTAAQLADIDLGFGEGFPTLDEALEAFPHQRFNIDLKNFSAVEPFIDVIRQFDAVSRVLVASFDEKTRAQAVRGLPGVVSSATAATVMEGKIRSWLGLSADTWSVPPEIRAIQVPSAHWGMPIVTPHFVHQAHLKGLEVHVWTINDPFDMKRLLEIGVDGIVTDRCDLAVEVVAKNAQT